MFEENAQEGSNTVNMEAFIKSSCTQRQQFMKKQLTKAFMLLAEDAEGMVGKIKTALNFAQNLQGRDNLARNAVLESMADIDDDDMMPLDDLIEHLKNAVWNLAE